MIYQKIDLNKVEERYIIYPNGDIFDKKLSRYCPKQLNHRGYHTVWIATLGKKVYVNRLVLCKFCPNDNEIYLQVNHKDGKKTNNDISNLEWATQSENQKHAYQHGLLSRKAEKNSQSKLSKEQVLNIIDLLLQEVPIKDIASKFNVSKGMISRIRTGRAWVELTKDIEFPKSKYANHVEEKYIERENELLNDLQNNVDIDILSDKYHLSKRFIRDFKYRKLGIY